MCSSTTAAKGLRDWCHVFDLTRPVGEEALANSALVSISDALLIRLADITEHEAALAATARSNHNLTRWRLQCMLAVFGVNPRCRAGFGAL